MPLTIEEVQHIAELAKLELTDAEQARLLVTFADGASGEFSVGGESVIK
jgi:hypothetical protein